MLPDTEGDTRPDSTDPPVPPPTASAQPEPTAAPPPDTGEKSSNDAETRGGNMRGSKPIGETSVIEAPVSTGPIIQQVCSTSSIHGKCCLYTSAWCVTKCSLALNTGVIYFCLEAVIKWHVFSH